MAQVEFLTSLAVGSAQDEFGLVELIPLVLIHREDEVTLQIGTKEAIDRIAVGSLGGCKVTVVGKHLALPRLPIIIHAAASAPLGILDANGEPVETERSLTVIPYLDLRWGRVFLGAVSGGTQRCLGNLKPFGDPEGFLSSLGAFDRSIDDFPKARSERQPLDGGLLSKELLAIGRELFTGQLGHRIGRTSSPLLKETMDYLVPAKPTADLINSIRDLMAALLSGS